MIRFVAGRCPSAHDITVAAELECELVTTPEVTDEPKITAADLRPAFLQAFPPRMTVLYIQEVVAEFYGIDAAYMRAPDRIGAREKRVSHPRQVAMFLARDLTKHTLPLLGRCFGGRDHSTVIYAINAVQKRAANDPLLEMEIEVLRDRLGP